ncbi:heavy-metal resistance protein [Dyadobacter jejuensis]|uniref:Heavy-metal resistance protein n=1 Tax=Dyadobacter jejuensis TaxID=1082580 RepID=A0A316AQR7_9BACT|nr:periplasmic heavy metal sensor [Dyadobacter jejuensis]PWJ59942.1 heavy-metal resistance protein [Dyadobacter jejuensis]
MSKMRLLSFAVGFLLLVNLVLATFLYLGKPERRGFVRRAAFPKHMVVERLKLDAGQRAAYEELIKKHRVAVRHLNKAIGTAKGQWYRTLSGEHEEQADSLKNEIMELQSRLEGAHFRHFVALKKICRPDQLPEYQRLTQELAGFFSISQNNDRAAKD